MKWFQSYQQVYLNLDPRNYLRYSEITHSIKKFFSTLQLAWTLIRVRTFGKYLHSGFNGEFDYAKYSWRNREYIIPTSPMEFNNE